MLHLVEVAAALKAKGVDFHLRIIGPDSPSLTARQVRRRIDALGVSDAVEVLPGLSAEGLAEVLSETDLMVSVSAIEGFQLTILEAQAFGIPVVMYDLPWLTTVRGNAGLVTTRTGDPQALALAVAALSGDRERYEAMSLAGREFARTAASVDINALLVDLVAGRLAPEYSPEPTPEDARILTQWLVRYAERSIRHFERGSRSAEDERNPGDALRRAKAELRSIKNGPSFRIGRAITLLPRKFRDAFRGRKGS